MSTKLEAQNSISPATNASKAEPSKPRFTRKRTRQLAIKEVFVRGVRSYQVDTRNAGKRVRRFFATEKAAETFIEQETVRQVNIGRLAEHIDARSASDTAESLLLLKPFNLSLLSAIQDYTASRALLPAGASLINVVKQYAAEHAARAQASTVSAAGTAWLASLETAGRSQTYISGAKWRLNRFTDIYGTRSMADIEPKLIESWLAGQGKMATQSRKHFLTVLGSMFSYAVRKGMAPTNPMLKVDKVSVIRPEAGILSPTQLADLLKHLADDTVPFVTLSAFGGLRPAEVRRIDWRDINFKTGILTVKGGTSKTGRRRTVPMAANLVAWLQPLAKESGPVVTLSEPTIRQKRLAPAKLAAGIKDWPHDCLRHSAATYMLETGKNAAEVALHLGHSETVLHQHYKGLLADPADAAAWFAILPAPEWTKAHNVIQFKAVA